MMFFLIFIITMFLIGCDDTDHETFGLSESEYNFLLDYKDILEDMLDSELNTDELNPLLKEQLVKFINELFVIDNKNNSLRDHQITLDDLDEHPELIEYVTLFMDRNTHKDRLTQSIENLDYDANDFVTGNRLSYQAIKGIDIYELRLTLENNSYELSGFANVHIRYNMDGKVNDENDKDLFFSGVKIKFNDTIKRGLLDDFVGYYEADVIGPKQQLPVDLEQVGGNDFIIFIQRN